LAVIRLCLDTTAYSRLMRGQPKLQERLESADEVLLPVTVLGELYAGFEGGSRMAANLALLAAFRKEARSGSDRLVRSGRHFGHSLLSAAGRAFTSCDRASGRACPVSVGVTPDGDGRSRRVPRR
jgi:hypothetical protein